MFTKPMASVPSNISLQTRVSTQSEDTKFPEEEKIVREKDFHVEQKRSGRGRVETELNVYLEESKAKIRSWKESLENKTGDERKLKSQILALEHRMAKRQKMEKMKNKLDEKKSRIEDLAALLAEAQCDCCTNSLNEKLKSHETES